MPKPIAPQKKTHKAFVFKIYAHGCGYNDDYELLATTTLKFRDITLDGNRVITDARAEVEEHLDRIAHHGITVENPPGHFTFFPPNRIAKIEFSEAP